MPQWSLIVQESNQNTPSEETNEAFPGMTRLVRDEDPDILTGHNIDNFDLPRISQRAEDLRKDSGSMLICLDGASPCRGWFNPAFYRVHSHEGGQLVDGG